MRIFSVLTVERRYISKANRIIGEKMGKTFGGYSVSFKKVKEWPIEKIFGTGNLAPSEMTKKLWTFVKKHNLAGK